MNLEAADPELRRHELTSPEGVRLDFAVAGPAPRIFAYGIDFIIISFLLFLLIMALVVTLPIGVTIQHWLAAHGRELQRQARSGHPNPQVLGAFEGIIIAVVMLVQFVVEFGYFTFWEMVTNGRSPGKAAIGLRVLRRDGRPIDLRSSLVRNVMRIIDMMPAYYLVGLISIILSHSSERLGDHAAGTIVVRLDRPEAAARIDTETGSSTLTLTREQLSSIGPRELRLVRTTLRRVEESPVPRSDDLLHEVAEVMRTRLNLSELPNYDARRFLRELLSQAERYTHNRPR